MPSSLPLAPALVLALASVRAAIREADPSELGLLYALIEELAGEVLAAILVLKMDGPRSAPSPPALSTPEEAAMELHLHPETVRVMCRRRELAAIKVGRSWRLPREAIEKWKRDHMTV